MKNTSQLQVLNDTVLSETVGWTSIADYWWI